MSRRPRSRPRTTESQRDFVREQRRTPVPRQSQYRRKQRALKKARKKRRRRIFFRSLFLLLLLAALVYGLFRLAVWTKQHFFTYQLKSLPTLSEENLNAVLNETVVSKTVNRPLSTREKEEDIEQVKGYIAQIAPAGVFRKEQLERLDQGLNELKSQVRDLDDNEFLNRLFQIVNNENTWRVKLLGKGDYLALRNALGSSFFEPKSIYSKPVTDSKTVDRYQKMEGGETQVHQPMELSVKDPSILYVRVKDMYFGNYDKEAENYRKFLKEKEGRILLIDLRGVKGFSHEYWQKVLMGPLLETQVGSTEKIWSVYDDEDYMNYLVSDEKMPLFSMEEYRLPLKEIGATWISRYPNRDFYREMSFYNQPGEVLFTNHIVLLADQTTEGAAEMFASFLSQNHLGTLCGTTTANRGLIPQPMLFQLKHSGVLIQMNPFFPLNSDGTIMEKGVAPSRYYPQEDALEALLTAIREGDF